MYIHIYIFKEQMIKIQFNYYSEFYDANLQQSSLQFTLQSQVSIMVSVMTL